MGTIAHSATYSPEDNKLRLSPAHRLDKDEYDRVKAAGFSWAPKQEIFVAGMWTPEREDLLIEMCGEIGDEDTTLVERAEQRAERFEEYGEKRAEDAQRARAQVESIAGGIPFGQPILIGHHSERHARKDAEKIRSGMDRAVKMWETSNYWTSRAAGAIRHAKYKELPAVRHRRIKGLESDLRKHEKVISDARADLAMWEKVCGEGSRFSPLDGREVSPTERAVWVLGRMSGYDGMCFPLDKFPRNPPVSQYEGAMGLYSGLKEGIITVDQAREFFFQKCAARIAWAERWAAHYTNRIAYERAMMAESGGLVAEQCDIVTGGRVSCGGQWYTVTKCNRSGGRIVSVSVVGRRFGGAIGIEEIKAYEAPSEERAAAVKAAIKTPKLCNYAGPGFVAVTQAQWDSINTDYKGTRPLGKGAPRSKYGGSVPDIVPDETTGLHRVRVAMYAMLRRAGVAEMPAPRVTEYGNTDTHGLYPCYIIDAKQTPPPALPSEAPAPVQIAAVPDMKEMNSLPFNQEARPIPPATDTEFAAMRDALRTGTAVQAVSAPQLFPTPKDLARRMVQAAVGEHGCIAGARVLEPSAGTARLIEAVHNNATDAALVRVVAVEINSALVRNLEGLRQLTLGANASNYDIRGGDFLEMQREDLGEFRYVLMNPPFADSQDIAHVRHAYKFLAPGGRLVAIMGEGAFYRQDRAAIGFREWLEEIGGTSENLPAGSFETSGTSVNARMVVIERGQ